MCYGAPDIITLLYYYHYVAHCLVWCIRVWTRPLHFISRRLSREHRALLLAPFEYFIYSRTMIDRCWYLIDLSIIRKESSKRVTGCMQSIRSCSAFFFLNKKKKKSRSLYGDDSHAQRAFQVYREKEWLPIFTGGLIFGRYKSLFNRNLLLLTSCSKS